ncbi:MAG TPA: SGNH/GDSL hydrolase family protein [Candidatus Krumholzibacteria bacterium]|nr:SGNH/GDSL hydrolase family protein [Candidatus Krumholzibacteria bacterium]
MRKSLIILLGAALAGLLATGCDLEAPGHSTLSVEQPSGAAVFGNYVAVGNSLTAGFMDSGLILTGQATSYPQLIATQMGYPAGSFMQPLLAPPGLGSTALTNPMYRAGVLHYDAMAGSIAVLDSTHITEIQPLALAASWPVPYSNLGVPGATLKDFADALDSSTSQSPGNAFFDLILRNSVFGGYSMLEQLIARGPTICTFWLGNNDVLGGATSGQPNDGVVHAGEAVNLTPPSLFTAMYGAALDNITNGVMERHGFAPVIFVANIPSITSVPFFMPKALFAQASGIPEGMLAMEESDAQIVLFTALGYLRAHGGLAALPLPAEYTLSVAEAQLVANTVTSYNSAIAAAVGARSNVFLYDANAELAALDPMTEAAHFLVLASAVGPQTAAATTLFSLDGVHPNNRGYARVANGFLNAMNAQLGTDFPMVDLATVSWDPTHGTGYGTISSTTVTVSERAAATMSAVFR